jgi:hypothetical protein
VPSEFIIILLFDKQGKSELLKLLVPRLILFKYQVPAGLI